MQARAHARQVQRKAENNRGLVAYIYEEKAFEIPQAKHLRFSPIRAAVGPQCTLAVHQEQRRARKDQLDGRLEAWRRGKRLQGSTSCSNLDLTSPCS